MTFEFLIANPFLIFFMGLYAVFKGQLISKNVFEDLPYGENLNSIQFKHKYYVLLLLHNAMGLGLNGDKTFLNTLTIF